MNRSLGFCVLLVVFIFGTSAAQSACQWNYDSPADWKNQCNGTWSLCGDGARQTPINVVTNAVVVDASQFAIPLNVSYRSVKHSNLTENGQTIHVDVDSSNVVSGGPVNDTFILNQFHFHTPSEHRFDNVSSVLEVHFVHHGLTTNFLMVISVRFSIGHHNPWLDTILRLNNSVVGEEEDLPDLNPQSLMPSTYNYLYYTGSLTTPPCTENVHWVLLLETSEVSQDQADGVQHWEGKNNRPLQEYSGIVYKPFFESTPSPTAPSPPPSTQTVIITKSFNWPLAITIFIICGIITCGVLGVLYYRHRERRLSEYHPADEQPLPVPVTNYGTL